jgi:hypothetical protein
MAQALRSMMRIHRALALVVTALSLTMTAAHVLEMPRKLSYSIALYTAVNSTLYLYFAIFGAIFEVGAIVAVGALAWRVRDQPSGHWTLAAAIAVTLALVSWLILVQPVNSAIAQGASWSDLRLRWEVGHVVGFVLSLAGFVTLVIATVRDIAVSGHNIGARSGARWRARPGSDRDRASA